VSLTLQRSELLAVHKKLLHNQLRRGWWQPALSPARQLRDWITLSVLTVRCADDVADYVATS